VSVCSAGSASRSCGRVGRSQMGKRVSSEGLIFSSSEVSWGRRGR
jgi:hypothetical protein